MKKPKISIVVPVYNVEKYLVRCIDAIISQDNGDFELILVNDGSTDGSTEICEEYARNDKRIKLIQQENKGLGGARNTGIEAAQGEYILFVDSDDFVEKNLLEVLINKISTAKPDIIVFRYNTVNEDGIKLGLEADEFAPGTMASAKSDKKLLLIVPAAWNKLYLADLFKKNRIRFPEKVWFEDLRTTPKLLLSADSILFIDESLYNYAIRDGSIMNSGSKEITRNDEIMDAVDDLVAYIQSMWHRGEYREEIEFLAIKHILMNASMRVIAVDYKNYLLPEFMSYMNLNFPNYKENIYYKRMTGRQRLSLFLISNNQYRALHILKRLTRLINIPSQYIKRWIGV